MSSIPTVNDWRYRSEDPSGRDGFMGVWSSLPIVGGGAGFVAHAQIARISGDLVTRTDRGAFRLGAPHLWQRPIKDWVREGWVPPAHVAFGLRLEQWFLRIHDGETRLHGTCPQLPTGTNLVTLTPSQIVGLRGTLVRVADGSMLRLDKHDDLDADRWRERTGMEIHPERPLYRCVCGRISYRGTLPSAECVAHRPGPVRAVLVDKG